MAMLITSFARQPTYQTISQAPAQRSITTTCDVGESAILRTRGGEARRHSPAAPRQTVSAPESPGGRMLTVPFQLLLPPWPVWQCVGTKGDENTDPDPTPQLGSYDGRALPQARGETRPPPPTAAAGYPDALWPANISAFMPQPDSVPHDPQVIPSTGAWGSQQNYQPSPQQPFRAGCQAADLPRLLFFLECLRIRSGYRTERKTTPPQKQIHIHNIVPREDALASPNASFQILSDPNGRVYFSLHS
ncbi:uncharacterized protein LOC115525013 [Lynx canadensis]|uniref:uncharacterized protein LOC115525013 n=1 Tax=Lynx canadensis TaxID=61383 RepID=UPI0011B0369C|nr:uncharacterized protein LOC115525013 [Lynx canadensis]